MQGRYGRFPHGLVGSANFIPQRGNRHLELCNTCAWHQLCSLGHCLWHCLQAGPPTWHQVSRVSVGVCCMCLGGWKRIEMMQTKNMARQTNISKYGLFTEDVYLLATIWKETWPFVGRTSCLLVPQELFVGFLICFWESFYLFLLLQWHPKMDTLPETNTFPLKIRQAPKGN